MMAQVPERISRATDGKVQVTLNDSQIGGTQITAAVRDGWVAMSGGLHTYLAGDDPRMGLFNLPGLVENMAEDADLGEAFWFEDVEDLWKEGWNSVVLAEGAWCTQALFSSEPIHTLEDFEGKRLRVHNPQTAALMGAIGAKPAPLPLSELPPAPTRSSPIAPASSTSMARPTSSGRAVSSANQVRRRASPASAGGAATGPGAPVS